MHSTLIDYLHFPVSSRLKTMEKGRFIQIIVQEQAKYSSPGQEENLTTRVQLLKIAQLKHQYSISLRRYEQMTSEGVYHLR